MSNDLKFNISVETANAMKQMRDLSGGADELNKKIKDIGKNASDIGKGAGNIGLKGIGETRDTDITNDSDAYSLFTALNNSLKQVNDNLFSLNKTISESNTKRTEITNKTTQTEPIIPRKELVKDNDNKSTTAPKQSTDIFQQAIQLGALGVAFKRYFGEGARESKEYESNALNIFGRTGIYGSDFNQARVDAYNLGGKYGYGMNQTMQVEDSIMRGGMNPGKKGELQQDTDSLLKFSKVYGLSPEMMSDNYARYRRRGAYQQGDSKEYTDLLATSVKANNMTGREQEQISSLNDIVDVLTSGKISVDSEDFKYIASIQTALGQRNEALKGEKGAEALQRFNGAINPQDDLMVRMVATGAGYGLGPEGLLKAKDLIRDGLSNPKLMQAIIKGSGQYGVDPNSIIGQNYWSDKLNVKSSVMTDLFEAVKAGNTEEYQKIYNNIENYNNQDYLYGNIKSSKALTQERYDISKENAKVAGGDKLNSLLSPFRNAVSSLPTGMQTGIGFGSIAIPAYLGSKFIPKMLTDFITKGGSSVSIPKIFGQGAGGTGLISKLGSIKGLEQAGTLGQGLGKVTPYLGKVGNALPYLGLGLSGLEAYSDYKQGDNKGAVQALSGGVGGLAGAKAGAIAGTAIAPGIGTAIGGIAGYFGGEKLSKWGSGKLYDRFTNKDINALESLPSGKATDLFSTNLQLENGLINRKDELLDKEEELVNKLLDKFSDNNNNKDPSKHIQDEANETKDTTDPIQLLQDSIKQGREFTEGTPLSKLAGLTDDTFDYLKDYAKQNNIDLSNANLSKDAQDEVNKIIGGLNADKQPFIKSMLPGAIDNYKKYGIMPSVSLSQGIHESNWGKSGLASKHHNLFGIKAGSNWNGQVANMRTAEYGKNGKYYVNANFRKYNNASESISDFGNFLKVNPRYGKAGLFDAKTAQGQVQAIRNAGYATDPGYVNKVMSISKSNHFDEIDKAILNGLKPGSPSYAVGIDRVGRDTTAYLHKDEAVLNKYDAKEYREGKLKKLDTNSLDNMKNFESNNMVNRNGDINLNIDLTVNNADQDIIKKVSKMIDQAIKMAQNNNPGVNLNKSFKRVPI